MDKTKAGELNMDARTLDVREAGIDAAEDRFFTIGPTWTWSIA